jgi:hypothetical protein
MELLVISKGKRRFVKTKALLPGKEGNLQTLAELLPMIRADAEDVELRRFVLGLIADCDNSFESQCGKLFEYAKSIRYVRDPLDRERLADAATTIDEQAGDCADKSGMLASMLATIGYLSRLRALNFFDDLATHGYDHLLVRVQHPDSGEWISLDATPEHSEVGFEPAAAVVTDFEIWAAEGGGSRQEQSAGLGGGPFDALLAQGIQIGSQLAAGAVQKARVSHAQEAQIGAQFDQAAGQVTAFFNQIQSQPVITQADLEAAIGAYTQLAQLAQQHGNVSYVTQQWTSANYKPAYEERLRQMAAVTTQAGSQQQQSAGVLGSVLPTSVISLLQNPLALLAGALLVVAVARRG